MSQRFSFLTLYNTQTPPPEAVGAVEEVAGAEALQAVAVQSAVGDNMARPSVRL